jgi:hypothetical protein
MRVRLLLWSTLALAAVGSLGMLLLQPSHPADVEALARAAVLKRLQGGEGVVFHEVRVHDYGVPGERGVCGQVEAPAGSGRHIQFAVRVLLPIPGEPGQRAEAQATLDNGTAAPRAVAETRRRYCREAAPPASTIADSASTIPAPPLHAAPEPVPFHIMPPATGTSAAMLVPAEAGGGGPARTLQRLLIRSPANLRERPQAGATVLRVLPRGLELQLHGRAPGGWLQVGDAEPWGWVHASLTATP